MNAKASLFLIVAATTLLSGCASVSVEESARAQRDRLPALYRTMGISMGRDFPDIVTVEEISFADLKREFDAGRRPVVVFVRPPVGNICHEVVQFLSDELAVTKGTNNGAAEDPGFLTPSNLVGIVRF